MLPNLFKTSMVKLTPFPLWDSSSNPALGFSECPRHSETCEWLILRILNTSPNATKSSFIPIEVFLPGRLSHVFMRPTIWITLEEPVCFGNCWRLVFLTPNLESLTNTSKEHQRNQHCDGPVLPQLDLSSPIRKRNTWRLAQ